MFKFLLSESKVNASLHTFCHPCYCHPCYQPKVTGMTNGNRDDTNMFSSVIWMVFRVRNFYYILHCDESKTQRKWFLEEKRDGLVDKDRINNQQNEKQQKVYKPKKSFCRSNLFQTINNQIIYTCFSPEYSF